NKTDGGYYKAAVFVMISIRVKYTRRRGHQEIEYPTDNDGQKSPFNKLKSHTGRLKTERTP
ncbi:hypothetical protein ACTHT3_19745, partial [Neisseria sp. P0015.S004]